MASRTGLYCPEIGGGFFTAGERGAKKGGVDGLGKLRSVSGAILTFWFFALGEGGDPDGGAAAGAGSFGGKNGRYGVLPWLKVKEYHFGGAGVPTGRYGANTGIFGGRVGIGKNAFFRGLRGNVGGILAAV
jgi:hypothetical protein